MKPWGSVCGACASGASVVCMSSMGAAMAATGAAVGASAASMPGMASMGASHASASSSLALTRFFEAIGLGVLNQLPNEVAQPLLAALLAITLGAAYIAYRRHGRLSALTLPLGSAVMMYVSIYIWMSEPIYFISLAGLTLAAIWGFFLARGPNKLLV